MLFFSNASIFFIYGQQIRMLLIQLLCFVELPNRNQGHCQGAQTLSLNVGSVLQTTILFA